eukprot:2749211-Rhodomonas_salina.1
MHTRVPRVPGGTLVRRWCRGACLKIEKSHVGATSALSYPGKPPLGPFRESRTASPPFDLSA